MRMLILLWLWAAAGCDPPKEKNHAPERCSDTDACRADADCPEADDICESCICVSNRCAADDPCRRDSDCAADELCENCICSCPTGHNPCNDDDDCGGGDCFDGCCFPNPLGGDPTNDCWDSYTPEMDCPSEDMDIVNLEATCDAAAATLRMTVAGGAPNPEPPGPNQRQVQFQEAEGGGGSYVVMTADAFDGPYTCSALIIAGGPPTGLPLGPGDSCGVSPDGQAMEFVLTSSSAGFLVARANGTTLLGEGADSTDTIDVTCPW